MKNIIKNIIHLIPSIIFTIIIVNTPLNNKYNLVDYNILSVYILINLLTIYYISNKEYKYYKLISLLIINTLIIYIFKSIIINKILIINVLLILIFIIYYQVLSKLKLKNYYILVLLFSFPIIQNYFSLKEFNNDISIIFNIGYALLLALLIFINNKWVRVILFNVLYIVTYIILLFQNLNYQILGSFFSFFDIYNFTEALDFVDIAVNVFISTFNISYIIGISFLIIGNIIVLKQQDKINNKNISIILLLALLFRFTSISLLYEEEVNTSQNKFFSNISSYVTYDRFTDRYNAMYISGIYEYTYKDIKSMISKKINRNDINFINEFIDSNNKEVSNDMTNILKDDNLIVILVETLDSWIVDDKTTPTISKMSKQGINFNHFYALNYNGGRTHNTGYTINTGFYIPTNYNVFESTVNEYDYSLPELFNNNGYKTTSIHANDGIFYAREDFHKAWGYQNSYFLEEYKKSSKYFNDIYLLDDDIYDLYVDKDNKFMSFVITYTGHGGYSKNKYCIAKNINEPEACYRYLINLTDQYIEGLVDKLTKDNLIDNTTIVLVSDHYSYTYDDQEYLKKQKNVINKEDIERVPFIIWNKSLKPNTINKYVETSDILPTIFNLHGIKYNPNFYMGDDIFSNTFNNYLLLKDDSLVNTNLKKDLDYALKNKDYGKKIITNDININK